MAFHRGNCRPNSGDSFSSFHGNERGLDRTRPDNRSQRAFSVLYVPFTGRRRRSDYHSRDVSGRKFERSPVSG